MSQNRDLGHPISFPGPNTRTWGTRIVAMGCALIALGGCRAHDFPQYDANYREYAYVTNSGSGTVSVYDVVNVRVDREIQVGQNPTAVAANPARNEVYVVNTGTPNGQGSVAVINAENNSVAGTIAVHKMPVAIALDPDGNTAYVVNSGSNTVSVLDLKAHREVGQIGVGEDPADARVSPDGKTLVVANRGGNSATIVDTGTRKVRAVFAGCPGASDVVILPDSSKAFAACGGGHQVMAMQLAHEARSDGRPATTDRLESLLDVGRAPIHLALKPDGGELFVSNSLSNSISEVVTSTDDVGGAYLMGAGPVRGLVSADNSLLYVVNSRSQEVTVFDIGDGRRLGGPGIHVGDGPSALAFSTAGHLLFVVDARSGDVAVVRTQSKNPAMFTMLPAGRGPNAIAVKSFKVS
ncbi:YncE family protein [Occallatibacter savannae]|uniref:YncE family protein n=1 Tax=Occallatibacter savannae TaxID=1002691 RepID=UPI001EF4B940|nr:YncE family protein [Occallatibacter savannae]